MVFEYNLRYDVTIFGPARLTIAYNFFSDSSHYRRSDPAGPYPYGVITMRDISNFYNLTYAKVSMKINVKIRGAMSYVVIPTRS